MNTTHSVALVDSASNMTSRGSASAGSNGKSTVTADTQPSPGFFKRYGLVFAVDEDLSFILAIDTCQHLDQG